MFASLQPGDACNTQVSRGGLWGFDESRATHESGALSYELSRLTKTPSKSIGTRALNDTIADQHGRILTESA